MADPRLMNKKELIEATLNRAQLSTFSKKEAELLLNTLMDVIK